MRNENVVGCVVLSCCVVVVWEVKRVRPNLGKSSTGRLLRRLRVPTTMDFSQIT
jgi:hypothetical protein